MPARTLSAGVTGELFRRERKVTIVISTDTGQVAIELDPDEECLVFRQVADGDFANLLPENDRLVLPDRVVSYCKETLCGNEEAKVNNPKLRQIIARLTAVKW